MAIIVRWGARNIFVPRSELTLVQTVPRIIYDLDMDLFRLALKALEDDDEGMSYPDTHQHTTEVTVGGVTLARVIEFINGFTVEFEDGQYAVNLKGANTNLPDVLIANQVSVRSANSAGLQTVISGSGLSSEQDQRLIDIEVALAAQGIQIGAVDAKVDDLDTDVAAVDQSLSDKIDDVPTNVWNYTQ